VQYDHQPCLHSFDHHCCLGPQASGDHLQDLLGSHLFEDSWGNKKKMRGMPVLWYKDVHIGGVLIVMLKMLDMVLDMLILMSLNKLMTIHMMLINLSEKVELDSDVFGEIHEHL